MHSGAWLVWRRVRRVERATLIGMTDNGASTHENGERSVRAHDRTRTSTCREKSALEAKRGAEEAAVAVDGEQWCSIATTCGTELRRHRGCDRERSTHATRQLFIQQHGRYSAVSMCYRALSGHGWCVCLLH